MKNLAIFIAAGIGYALVPEFANNVIVNLSWRGYMTTIFVLTPILFFIGWVVNNLVNKIKSKRVANIIYYLFFGFGGLMIEWFVIGNSPWANPSAIQFAMVFYWAAQFTIPRILTDPDPAFKPLKKKIIKFYVVYSVSHLIFSLLIGRYLNARLVPLLWTVVYTWLNLFYIIPYMLKKPIRQTYAVPHV